MTESEFWDALEQVFGPALGHSLVKDLYLPVLRATAADSLADGTNPDVVWRELVLESGVDQAALWVHRRPQPKRG